MTDPASGMQVDPQRVIARLTRQLADAYLLVAQYGALADQLLAERQEGTSAPPERAG